MQAAAVQPGLGRGPWKSERGAVAVAPGSAPPTVRPTNKTAAQLLRERLAGIRTCVGGVVALE